MLAETDIAAVAVAASACGEPRPVASGRAAAKASRPANGPRKMRRARLEIEAGRVIVAILSCGETSSGARTRRGPSAKGTHPTAFACHVDVVVAFWIRQRREVMSARAGDEVSLITGST